jgi:hypothetical protein
VDVAGACIVGEQDVDRRRRAAGAAALIEHGADGLGGGGAAREGLANRDVELAGPFAIAQAQKARRRATEVPATKRDLLEERGGARRGGREPIAAAELAGALLVLRE